MPVERLRAGGWMRAVLSAALPTAVLVLGVLGPAAARANSAYTAQPISVGQISTIGGRVTLPAGSDTLGGPGLLRAIGTPRRGIVQVNRTTPTTAHATVLGAVQNARCGDVTVQAELTVDDSACQTASTGVCSVFVGVNIDVPPTAASGSCTFPEFTIQIDFF